MARKEKELAARKKQLAAEEEFRRQVDRECAYYRMTRGDLAKAVPMPASTLSDLMKEPSMFRVWQLQRIAQILRLPASVIAPVLGMEVPADASATPGLRLMPEVRNG